MTQCNCNNVDIGSYKNQVTLPRPIHMKNRREGSSNPESICVDACIAEEILALWACGIRTTGCCCGHNKQPGYVGVIDADIELMKSMGYEVQHNQSRPDACDTFNLKSEWCSVCKKLVPPANLQEVMQGLQFRPLWLHDNIDHMGVNTIGLTRH